MMALILPCQHFPGERFDNPLTLLSLSCTWMWPLSLLPYQCSKFEPKYVNIVKPYQSVRWLTRNLMQSAHIYIYIIFNTYSHIRKNNILTKTYRIFYKYRRPRLPSRVETSENLCEVCCSSCMRIRRPKQTILTEAPQFRSITQNKWTLETHTSKAHYHTCWIIEICIYIYINVYICFKFQLSLPEIYTRLITNITQPLSTIYNMFTSYLVPNPIRI